MSLIAVIAVLCLVATGSGQKIEDPDAIECPGGYCTKKNLCPDATTALSVDTANAQDTGLITLRLQDTDECLDYMLMCCTTLNAPLRPISNEEDEEIEVPPSSYDQCGQSNEQGLVYNFHHNDTLAQYGEFPWMVAVRQIENKDTKFLCGGTLTHPRIVITTAHNVDGKANLIARLGEWDVSTTKEPFPYKDVAVERIITHPAYRYKPISNDIALLVLEDSVVYEQHIRPVCLPAPQDRFTGIRCFSTGWGEVGGIYANIMKKIELPILSRDKCLRSLRAAGLGQNFSLSKDFMCAGGEANVDMCKGDGGSPLVCPTDDGSFVLAGIVSWGIGCGGHNIPGVYVAVSNYVEWIEETVENISMD